MADNDQNNDQTPKSVDQLLAQIEASFVKESTNALKSKLTGLLKTKKEHERAAAQVQVQIDEEIAKFKAGL